MTEPTDPTMAELQDLDPAFAQVRTTEQVKADGSLLVDLANKASSRTPYFISTGQHGESVADLFIFVKDEGQELETVDLTQYLPAVPRQMSGHPVARDAASFVAYVQRHHKDERSTFWADAEKGEVLCIFDDLPREESGYMLSDTEGRAVHRVTLRMRPTADWKAWVEKDKSELDQLDFAEFLEDNAALIRNPPAADFLAIARTFTAKRNLAFESAQHLESGAVKLVYNETVAAGAGHKGEVSIPEQFEIAIQPFEGSATLAMTARFRYRIANGGVKLSYRLVRPDLVRDAAFESSLGQIAEELGGVTIMSATPGR